MTYYTGSTVFGYKAGLGNAASYQVSGIPWVTGNVDAATGADSTQGIRFPSVTQWIVVSNNSPAAGQTCRVAFSRLGCIGTSGNYYLEVPSGSVSPRLEVKVTQLFLSGSENMSVIAGLAGIESTKLDYTALSPSGSNWSGSLAAQVG